MRRLGRLLGGIRRWGMVRSYDVTSGRQTLPVKIRFAAALAVIIVGCTAANRRNLIMLSRRKYQPFITDFSRDSACISQAGYSGALS